EPELAHEEVVELVAEAGADVAVRALLVRESDVEPDRPSARVGGAAVGGLHDPSPTAAADEQPARRRTGPARPLRYQTRELERLGVVAPERSVAAHPGGSEEHDGVVDTLALEGVQRLEILGEDAQRPCGLAVEERRVAIGERRIDGRHGVRMVSEQRPARQEASVSTRSSVAAPRSAGPRTS